VKLATVWFVAGLLILSSVFVIANSNIAAHILFPDVYTVNEDHSPPYFHSVLDGPPEAEFHAGQRVYLHMDDHRLATCDFVWSFRILQLRDNDERRRIVWHNFSDTTGWSLPGNYSSEWVFDIPDIPSGDYSMSMLGTFFCKNNRFMQPIPLIPFKIVG
jgi:hypothetical protein